METLQHYSTIYGVMHCSTTNAVTMCTRDSTTALGTLQHYAVMHCSSTPLALETLQHYSITAVCSDALQHYNCIADTASTIALRIGNTTALCSDALGATALCITAL